MDTSAVIQLSCQAAESVLRFRAVGFTRRPVIDLQSFRAAIAAQIEKVAKDHRHRFEIPLSEVVTYAGVGAARAAQQWNDISHKENHVVTEWFRNCVCNLVSGVVNDIGQMAFEDQGMNACMYLEPDEYDPFDVPSYTRAAPVSKSSIYIRSGVDDYYGFPQVETQKTDDSSAARNAHLATSNSSWTTFEPPRPFRHEVEKGYKALDELAASQEDTSARADFIQKTKRLRNVSDPVHADSQDMLLKRPTKRARQDPSPSRPSPLSAGPAGSASDSVNKVQKNFRWTDDEINILVTSRDFGRSWSEVVNMLPRHTWMSCQTKYRMVKNKEGGKSDGRPPVDAPAVRKQGQSDKAQVVQGGMEAGRSVEDKDETTTSRNGLQAVGMDIDDHGNQGGKKSMVAASRNAAEPEQDVGGDPAEEPTTENME
ncbi:hypothetical protein INS49_007747 [Diaporthe citri]|uniref:uncharacterized protein n=1 Tax=Diaporthe citri TaxID=83186 RepID=UPI001C80BD62|nr:uncharacterized protein INS49_007747 [Diaporthe citri]KAG6362655.1 hypothetical protein INS49_007747 [Diaporthe citri]